MAIKVLYFAALREAIGESETLITPPDTILTVADLFQFILEQHAEKAERLRAISGLQCAINQTLCDWNTALNGAEEVAFFPPMTGG